MSIGEIYQKYFIPLNLQTHMLRVASLGQIICDHITVDVNKDVIVKTLLLHDMGNIIKFNFERTNLLVTKDRKKIDEYRRIQKEFRRRYGEDADKATVKIAKEITSDTRIIDLIAQSHGSRVREFLHKEDEWEKKISYYCDMRIGPYGVLRVDERFNDLKKRYPKEVEVLETYYQQCREVERQLQEVVTIDVQGIDERMVEKLHESLLSVDI